MVLGHHNGDLKQSLDTPSNKRTLNPNDVIMEY